MTLKTDGFSVAGGMWTATQQTSHQPVGRSTYVRQHPGRHSCMHCISVCLSVSNAVHYGVQSRCIGGENCIVVFLAGSSDTFVVGAARIWNSHLCTFDGCLPSRLKCHIFSISFLRTLLYSACAMAPWHFRANRCCCYLLTYLLISWS